MNKEPVPYRKKLTCRIYGKIRKGQTTKTENMESSAIQLSIDAINNDTAKLGVELDQIQQKQESLMIDERSLIESQVKFESKKLQVSTLCFLLLIV